jgi:DNA-binding beta-propeller fold protein YncE
MRTFWESLPCIKKNWRIRIRASLVRQRSEKHPTISAFFILSLFIIFIPFFQLSVSGQEKPDALVRSVEIIDSDHLGNCLTYPSTIFFDAEEDEIYITDAGKGQLVVYNCYYFPHLAVGSGRGLNSINSCYVSDDKIFVSTGNSKIDPKGHITILNRAFLPIKNFYFSGFKGADKFLPRKMVIGTNGNIYVVGVNSTAVIILNPEGQYLRSISPRDEVLGVNEPAPIISLCMGRDGKLYCLSEEMGRIYVYDLDEHFLYKFGQKGGDRGKLSRPRGIAADDERDRVYIVDYMRHTISVYSKDGKFLFDFGGKGYSRGWFLYPTDICIDGRGRLLITDTFNHRVQVFEVLDRESPDNMAPAEGD